VLDRRFRPERANHVWAYEFVEDLTRDGRTFGMLCVVDEFTREALAIRVARRLTSSAVNDVLGELFLAHRTPAHIRSDQGPEFIAEAANSWIAGVVANTAYIEKASPWENGYVESFSGELRDELLNGEVFNTLREAQVLIGVWRRHYNLVRSQSSLGVPAPAFQSPRLDIVRDRSARYLALLAASPRLACHGTSSVSVRLRASPER